MYSSDRDTSPTPRVRRLRRARRSAFSLIEVMTASCILMVGLGGTVLTVKTSLTSISHARHLGAASQILQSELERLRLRSWEQLQAIQDSADTSVVVEGGATNTSITCTREIVDLRDGLKEITVEARWGGSTGRVHSARLVTRYARNGLNDYFYTSH